MSNWWYRWARDNAFPILYWIGTWSIFDWIQSFHGWLDNTLPWRLRARVKAMHEENRDLCTQLQQANWEILMLKLSLKEALRKMHMPIRGGYNPRIAFNSIENDAPFPATTIYCDFERFRVSIMLDKSAWPRYSPHLLDYMSEHTAEILIDHTKNHIYKEVKKFYDKEFQGEIDGS